LAVLEDGCRAYHPVLLEVEEQSLAAVEHAVLDVAVPSDTCTAEPSLQRVAGDSVQTCWQTELESLGEVFRLVWTPVASPVPLPVS
jgi:hypothetical protein